jgi:oxygen-independent coproporphyrinogen III oxidase
MGFRGPSTHRGSMSVEFNPELLQRYGGNVPRYTSYPTAVQFHERISAADYEAAARGRSASPVSVYVHVPFCWSPCYYCACNRIITHQANTATQYVAHLTREIELRARCFEEGRRPAEQLHFGGGTPTYLSTAIISRVVETIGRYFPLTHASGRDYSIEIDPRTLASSTLAELKQIGFNRLSLGVQDFDPAVQRIINRVQPEEMVRAALDEARRLQYSSVNFDLIYGLPAQSPFGFAATLDRVMAMRPDRIAVYGYAHLPSLFKAQNRFRNVDLPDAKTRIALLGLAIRELGKAGYVHIGMDHFALPGDSLARARKEGSLQRSFQGYTTHADMDLVNFGASAIGRVGDLFVQNVKHLNEYNRAIDGGTLPLSKGLRLTRDDQIRADVIQRIMCQRRVGIDELEARWGFHFADYFGREIESLQFLQRDELITLTQHEIEVTPRGGFLLRNIAVAFDAYARTTAPERASRAI